jgi:hypothetical protein
VFYLEVTLNLSNFLGITSGRILTRLCPQRLPNLSSELQHSTPSASNLLIRDVCYQRPSIQPVWWSPAGNP